MQSRSELPGSRRVIVKIGSALLTAGGKGLDQAAIGQWVQQIAELRQRGIPVSYTHLRAHET